MGGNHLPSSSTILASKPYSCCIAMLSVLLFIQWWKEKEMEEDEEMVIRLSLLESLKGVTH